MIEWHLDKSRDLENSCVNNNKLHPSLVTLLARCILSRAGVQKSCFPMDINFNEQQQHEFYEGIATAT